MNNYNLLLIVYGLYSGGVEQMLINYLTGEEFKNFNMFIAYSGNADERCLEKFRENGFIPIKLKYRTKNRIRYFCELKKVIKKYKIDIVHSNINIDNFLALMAAKSCGITARISHSHGLPIPTKNKLKNTLRQLKILLCNKYSSYNLACSKKAGEYLYRDNNFEIIYNAIQTGKFKFNQTIRKKIRKELDIQDKVVIGYIARFGNGKNHYFLIDIAEKLSNISDSFKFLFIGAGPLKEEIENKIKETKMEKKFIILSSKENIEDYYQAMDLFVFPSEEEGLGMVAIEAQLNNLYCLASTGVPEETKISNNIEFLKLDRNLWLNKIETHLKLREQDTNYKIDSDNYDISKQRKKLYDIYEKELKK